MLQRVYNGDGSELASTLCNYDLRKGVFFVVLRGSVSSELLSGVEDVCSISLLPLVARCLDIINVCIWRMFVFMSMEVTVWECLLCSGRC